MTIPSAKVLTTVKPFSATFPNWPQSIAKTAKETGLRKRTLPNIFLIGSLDLILTWMTYLTIRMKKMVTCSCIRLLQTTMFREKLASVPAAAYMLASKTIILDLSSTLCIFGHPFKTNRINSRIRIFTEILGRRFLRNSDLMLFAS